MSGSHKKNFNFHNLFLIAYLLGMRRGDGGKDYPQVGDNPVHMMYGNVWQLEGMFSFWVMRGQG